MDRRDLISSDPLLLLLSLLSLEPPLLSGDLCLSPDLLLCLLSPPLSPLLALLSSPLCSLSLLLLLSLRLSSSLLLTLLLPLLLLLLRSLLRLLDLDALLCLPPLASFLDHLIL